jgi:beta-glucanase (GH16 family)
MTRNHVIIVFLALFLALPAHAINNYWAGATATGTGDCSSSANRCTIPTANASGSVVVGASGSCVAATGWITIPNVGACIHLVAGSASGGQIVTNKGGGTSTQRIAWISDTKWGFVYVMTSGTANNVWATTSQWQVISGVDASTTLTGTDVGTTGLITTASNVAFYGNRVHDIALGLCSDNGGAGISDSNQSLTNIQAIGNYVYNVGGPGRAGNCRFFHGIYFNNPNDIIQNNQVTGSPGWGITCRHNCASVVISGNTVWNNGGYGFGNQPASGSPPTCCSSGTKSGVGGGILVGNDSGHQTTTTITNNITYNNGASDGGPPTGYACGIWDYYSTNGSQNTTNSLVSNNIVYDPSTGTGDGTPCSATQGVTGGSISLFGAGTIVTANTFSNPLLVNYQPNSAADVHLQPGSPAAGTGTTTCTSGGITPCSPANDFDGVTRATPPSRGALEPSGVTPSLITISPPTSFDFANVQVGVPAVHTFHLSNNAVATVTFSGASVTGAGLSITANSCTSLAPSAGCDIDVTSNPLVPGPFSGTLTVNHSASNSPSLASITGTGTQPAIVVNPSSMNFPAQNVGTTGSTPSTVSEVFGIAALNVDDSFVPAYPPIGWKLPLCVLPACNPGGAGVPTASSLTLNNGAPTQGTTNMKLSETGPSFTNVLAPRPSGRKDDAQILTSDFWFYLSANAAVLGSIEFDQYIFAPSIPAAGGTNGTNFMFGKQCNQTNGLWQVWDQLNTTWRNTAKACSLSYGAWHHIIVRDHRVPGDASCSGQACLHYDSITLDGVTTNWNLSWPAGPLPVGWAGNTGLQFQIDIGSGGGLGSNGQPVDLYLDEIKFGAGGLSSLWAIDSGAAPGNIAGVNNGTFSTSNVDVSQGALGMTVSQGISGALATSVGSQVRSISNYGYGSYGCKMRAASTATSPLDTGAAVSGQVSSCLEFISNSLTEIDQPSIEGRLPNVLNWNNYINGIANSQLTSTTPAFAPDQAYHTYKALWQPGSIAFSVDGTVVSTHNLNIPISPAPALFNVWGTNSNFLGGTAVSGARAMYVDSFSFVPLSNTIYIYNTGTAPLKFTSVPAVTAPFSISANTCPVSPATLPVGSNCSLAISFSPLITGPISGNLSLVTNSAVSPLLVPLTAAGGQPSVIPPSGFVLQQAVLGVH